MATVKINSDMLKSSILQAINVYEQDRAKILKEAFNEGGGDLVNDLENEHDALRDAYYEVFRKELDQNHTQFTVLLQKTKVATNEIEKSIKNLRTATDVLNALGTAINLIGRVLIILSI